MKTYEVKFNDFGLCYVIAENFSDAESKFIKSGNGGEVTKIKSIVQMLETNEPII